MKKIVLSLAVLAAMSAGALASQRGNDPVVTLNGKALGTGGTGSGNTSVTGSANAYGLAIEPRHVKRQRMNAYEQQRSNSEEFYSDRFMNHNYNY